MDYARLLASLDCPICLQPLKKRESSSSPDHTPHGKYTKQEIESNKVKTTSSLHVDDNELICLASITSPTPSFEITRARSLEAEEHENAQDGQDAESNVSLDEDEVALLTCGHLLHYTCALQMYEYHLNNNNNGSNAFLFNRKVCSCPVCRSPFYSMEDIIPFHPQEWTDNIQMHYTDNSYNNNTKSSNSTTTTTNNNNNSSNNEMISINQLQEIMEIEITASASITTPTPTAAANSETEVHSSNVECNNTVSANFTDVADKHLARKRKRYEQYNNMYNDATYVSVDELSDSSNAENDNCHHSTEEKTHNTSDSHDELKEKNEQHDNIANSDKDNNNDNNVDDDDNDDITLIGTRQRPHTEIYLEQLNRKTSLIIARNTVLHDRKLHLSHSLKELEEECNELNSSITSARLLSEIMHKHGLTRAITNAPSNNNNNNNNHKKSCDSNETDKSCQPVDNVTVININNNDVINLDEGKLRDTAHYFSPLVPSKSEVRKRKTFLRQMCADNEKAPQTATIQLANVISESAHVRRQIEKYTYKLNKLSALMHQNHSHTV